MSWLSEGADRGDGTKTVALNGMHFIDDRFHLEIADLVAEGGWFKLAGPPQRR